MLFHHLLFVFYTEFPSTKGCLVMRAEEFAILSWTMLYRLMNFQEFAMAVFPRNLQLQFYFSLRCFII